MKNSSVQLASVGLAQARPNYVRRGVTKAQATALVHQVGMELASLPGSKRRRRKDLFLLFGSGNEASLRPNPECLLYPPLPMVLLGSHNLGVCSGHAHEHRPRYHCCGHIS